MPFDQEEKPKLALTLENVEIVLDELRPYLRSDGGDCRIVEIDGPVVRFGLADSIGERQLWEWDRSGTWGCRRGSAEVTRLSNAPLRKHGCVIRAWQEHAFPILILLM